MPERNQHYTNLCELTNNPEAAIHCKGRLCWQQHQLSWEKTGYKEWKIATKLEKNSSDFSAAVKLWQIFSCLILICFVSCCFIFGLILELKQVPCLSANTFCKAGAGSVSRCAVCAARDTKGRPREENPHGSWFAGSRFLSLMTLLPISVFSWVWTTDTELSQGSAVDCRPAQPLAAAWRQNDGRDLHSGGLRCPCVWPAARGRFSGQSGGSQQTQSCGRCSSFANNAQG